MKMDFNESTEEKMPEIIPFGKYKGQPVEVLASDKSYTDWLCAQEWFRSRFQGIHTLIVNNFNQASDTPDHNALQARFLDDGFCIKTMNLIDPGWSAPLYKEVAEEFSSRKKRLKSEITEAQTSIERYSKNDYYKDTIPALLDKIEEINKVLNSFPAPSYKQVAYVDFEVSGADVVLACSVQSNNLLPDIPRASRYRSYATNVHPSAGTRGYRLELKPVVSDDYPSILRQMKASKCDVLVTRAYTGSGATEDQFRQIFMRSNIKVLMEHEIDQYGEDF